MIYPKSLNKVKTMGIFAPSSGVGNKLERLEIVKKYFEKQGYRLEITKSVTNSGIVSNTPEIRIKEFEALLKNDKVDVIFCASGGEFAIEIAPYIDFKLLKKYPKYIVGFSDSTIITYLTMVNADIATITSYNFINISKVINHESLENLLKIINNENVIQKKYDFYGNDKNNDSLVFNVKTQYVSNRNKINISARIIGGTVECLSEILGMPYNNTNAFISKYEEDGFIWYFDICEMNSNDFYRTLLRMNHLGYFKNVKAVLIGRKTKDCEERDIGYFEAILKIFGDIPIIEDVDIGHTYPMFSIINGAIANIKYENNDFSLSFENLWSEK